MGKQGDKEKQGEGLKQLR